MDIDTILKKYSAVIENQNLRDKSLGTKDLPKQDNKNEIICVLNSSDEENNCYNIGKSCVSDKKLSEVPSCSFQNENGFKKQLPRNEKYSSESSDDDLPYISPVKNQKQDIKLRNYLDYKQTALISDAEASCSLQQRLEKPQVLSEISSSSSENENELWKQFRSPERYSVESSEDDVPYISPIKKQKLAGSNGDCLDHKQNEREVDAVASCSSQEHSETSGVPKVIRKRTSPSEKEKEKLEKAKARAEKIAERNKLKIQAEKEKAEKRVLQNLQKNLKPDQCLKTVTVYIDSNIIDQKYGGEILNTLKSSEVSCKINQQLLPGVITWSSQVQTQLSNENGQLSLTDKKTEADEVLIIMNWHELIDLVSKETFVPYIKELKDIYINKRIIVGIYGLEAYFRYHKNKRRRDFRSAVEGKGKKAKTSKDEKVFEDAPVVTERFLEDALTKAQIIYSCNHRMVESSQDLAQLVLQFTKSIAQIPYKLEKRAKDEQFRMYISGENRDCVNVDKNGNGLQRLWSQQLTMFPLASLETAEAIMSKYPTPASLMEAYEMCETSDEGEKLLQAIPVRRTAGPLANDKKIGPELSKRIYKFFTSTDGDIVL